MFELPTPRTPDPTAAPPLRWGVIGTGWIARTFVDALRSTTRQQAVAVGSRGPDRARAFAAEVGGLTAHGSYADLVADPAVDVVYVGSPHSVHREHALLALEAGKPVLVEKAFTRNAAEAREVFDAAAARDLFCMEAMWTHFLPHIDVLRQAVASGLLGTVHTVLADHGQPLYPDGPRRLADPELAGGALLDLGVYPVAFARHLLGPVEHVAATGTLTPDGVDAQATVALRTVGGAAHAALSTTMLAKTPTTAAVCGSEARIEIEGDFYQPSRLRLRRGDEPAADEFAFTLDPPHRGMGFEAAEVARCVSEGRTASDLLPPEETIAVMEILDECRRQVGVRFPGE